MAPQLMSSPPVVVFGRQWMRDMPINTTTHAAASQLDGMGASQELSDQQQELRLLPLQLCLEEHLLLPIPLLLLQLQLMVVEDGQGGQVGCGNHCSRDWVRRSRGTALVVGCHVGKVSTLMICQ